MDIIGSIILFGFILIIIYYFNNIRDILIPTDKSMLEVVTVTLSIAFTLYITFTFGVNILHYLIGVLGTIILALGLFRRGITKNGFQSMRGLHTGSWDRISAVNIEKSDSVKISFTSQSFFYEVQYYSWEYYEDILELLEKNLSKEILFFE